MLTLALDIVTTAAILFIVSAGLLIVFGVMKIINFAHGAFLTVGGYAALLAHQARTAPGLWSCRLPLSPAPLAACVDRAARRAAGFTSARWTPSSRRGDSGSLSGRLITLIFGREVQFVQAR